LKSARENSLLDPISKIPNTNWAVGMTQVVEHLFNKHEALSSNSSTVGKKKKEE
jgi:hypothetical protein